MNSARITRRQCLELGLRLAASGGALSLSPPGRTEQAAVSPPPTTFASVAPRVALSFPRDHGSHPAFRTEWWYLTGHVKADSGREFGFQVTFFRQATGLTSAGKSAFTPRQIIIAHVAVTDIAAGKLLHEEKAARPVLGLAGAGIATTDVWVDRWRLTLLGNEYRVAIHGDKVTLDLTLISPAPLLQGDAGFSRKGPLPQQASYYYSRPQLRVAGTLGLATSRVMVTGRAWLDHEWSSEVMAGDAVGWDWIGMNLADGGALMAFRMRNGQGGALWAGATWQQASGAVRQFAPGEIRWANDGAWQSPDSGARYPAKLTLELAGERFQVVPRVAAQEVDARLSTGTIYWEGLSELKRGAEVVGVGYLEMTGYWKPLKF